MEMLLLIFSLVILCTSLIILVRGGKERNKEKLRLNKKIYFMKKTPQTKPANVISINDILKDDALVGIIVYRITKPAQAGIYDKEGKIIKRNFPHDRYI